MVGKGVFIKREILPTKLTTNNYIKLTTPDFIKTTKIHLTMHQGAIFSCHI